MDCGDPGTPTNGSRLLADTVYKSQVSYLCSHGFSLTGSQNRSCLSTGQWSNALPSCTGKICKLNGCTRITRDLFYIVNYILLSKSVKLGVNHTRQFVFFTFSVRSR